MKNTFLFLVYAGISLMVFGVGLMVFSITIALILSMFGINVNLD